MGIYLHVPIHARLPSAFDTRQELKGTRAGLTGIPSRLSPLKIYRRNPSHPAATAAYMYLHIHIFTCNDTTPPPLMFYCEIPNPTCINSHIKDTFTCICTAHHTGPSSSLRRDAASIDSPLPSIVADCPMHMYMYAGGNRRSYISTCMMIIVIIAIGLQLLLIGKTPAIFRRSYICVCN
jgi:hypothetical protein